MRKYYKTPIKTTLNFIVIYFISLSDRLLAPSFDCIYCIDFFNSRAPGKGDNNLKRVYSILIEDSSTMTGPLMSTNKIIG